ncbi:MAG: hypothetical protein L6Q60_07990 [Rhodocyclaceae bacterium]|nr:hypothetical protein [Rhodocyclaceae bacterium]
MSVLLSGCNEKSLPALTGAACAMQFIGQNGPEFMPLGVKTGKGALRDRRFLLQYNLCGHVPARAKIAHDAAASAPAIIAGCKSV